MGSHRPKLAVAVLALVALVAAACSSGDTSSPTGSTQAPAGQVLVGSIASQTGSGAPYGTGQLNGQQLALDLLGPDTGFPLRMTNVDDTSTGGGGVAAMGTLATQGAVAVLGPTLSPVAAEADRVAQQAGMPVLAVTNTTLDIGSIGDMVWRISLSEEAMIPQAIAAARAEHGFATAALIYDSTDGYATGAAQAFRSGAARHGVTLTIDEGFAPGTGQAVPALRRAQGTNPDALFFAARSAAATELLLGAAQLELPQPKVGGNGFNAPEVLSAAGAAAEGIVVAASWNIDVSYPASEAFEQAYRDRYGNDPDAFAAQGYAGIQVLLAALAASGEASRGGVQAGLEAIGTIDTVLGPLSFDGREAVYPAAVQVVQDGRFVLL